MTDIKTHELSCDDCSTIPLSQEQAERVGKEIVDFLLATQSRQRMRDLIENLTKSDLSTSELTEILQAFLEVLVTQEPHMILWMLSDTIDELPWPKVFSRAAFWKAIHTAGRETDAKKGQIKLVPYSPRQMREKIVASLANGARRWANEAPNLELELYFAAAGQALPKARRLALQRELGE